jgi:hypothetical protein
LRIRYSVIISASIIHISTTQAIASQQINNIKQRSPLISSKSDRLKYPHSDHTSDRPSTNQQQTAIAQNIHTFTNKRSPLNTPTTSNSDRPHSHQTAIALNTPTTPNSDHLKVHTALII